MRTPTALTLSPPSNACGELPPSCNLLTSPNACGSRRYDVIQRLLTEVTDVFPDDYRMMTPLLTSLGATWPH